MRCLVVGSPARGAIKIFDECCRACRDDDGERNRVLLGDDDGVVVASSFDSKLIVLRW